MFKTVTANEGHSLLQEVTALRNDSVQLRKFKPCVREEQVHRPQPLAMTRHTENRLAEELLKWLLVYDCIT